MNGFEFKSSITIINIIIHCITMCKCHALHCSNFDCEIIRYRIEIINYSKSLKKLYRNKHLQLVYTCNK